MSHTFQGRCRYCDESFTVSQGDGVFFHLLHCDRCGEAKPIGFEELGELHLRYLKSLPNGHCLLDAHRDAYVRVHIAVEPVSTADYRAGVHALAGECGCGGRFRFDAPPRCPVCRSTRITLAQGSGNQSM